MAKAKLSPTVKSSLELLGVDADATAADLKKAYRRMALLYHPDRNPETNAQKEFQKVTEAYELLCDPVRVAELNKRHLKERLHRRVVEGLEITFGSFFGYRIFALREQKELNSKLLAAPGNAKRVASGTASDTDLVFEPEESDSILDHAAYDALEVVYAGRFSLEDEQALKGELEGRKLARMPWVILNNQGILRYLEGDLRGSRKCYEELCARVPNNIIFTYRLGLCLILEGFRSPRKTLLGALKPDRIKIEKGLALLEHCLKLGAERKVGRQKCLVIRKTLADVLEKTGRGRKARAVWRSVFEADPACAEAAFKLDGALEAARLLKVKTKPTEASAAAKRALNPGRRLKN